jgi:signal transduction histidine kinase
VVLVQVDGQRLTLTVDDDGIGTSPDAAGGLVNLRERAVGLGGEFAVEPAEPRGTRPRWSVPLDD